MIKKLYETHIGVRDLETAMRFYEDILGLELAAKEESRKLACYWLGEPRTSFVGLWERPEDKLHVQHYAFEIDATDMDAAIAALHDKGVATHDFFGVETETPSVFGWMPAASIYFKDPDGHELEYIALLSGESRPDFGIQPWPAWKEAYGD